MKTVQMLAILVLTLALMPCPAASGISGSGTANHIPKFIDHNTLGDSAIYEASGKVSIGTTSPEKGYRLTVDGAGRLFGIYVRNTGDVGIQSIGTNYGLKASGNSRAIWGRSTRGIGVYGESKEGYAGYFVGGRNYFEGNVGIGMPNPGAKLEVDGQVKITGGWPGAGKILTSDASGLASWQAPAAGDSDWIIAGNDMYSAVSGNVGIGTTSPDEKLTVEGKIRAYEHFFLQPGTPTVDIPGVWGTVHAEYTSAGFDPIIGPIIYSETSGFLAARECVSVGPMFIKYNIGVYGEVKTGTGRGVYGKATDTGDIRNYGGYFEAMGKKGVGIYAKGGPEGYAAEFHGNVIIKNKHGNTTIMELGEGLDYAEGFDVSDESKIAPGSVLVIDSDNPGKLALSEEAYDKKVAGIVAGAKGQGSAVRIGAGQFDFDVALAGRVYCNVDATEAAVEPGDLLTTSVTAGYAMKATDYMRAQGAILGKAMEKLEKGKKEQILVLVTLQ